VYLQHLAAAVTRLNAVHHDVYRILFRRCPVDWSDRYADVLQQYPNLIHVVEPRWLAPAGSDSWQHIMPTREDVTLLVQTVQHASLTINIGSTTALDFAVLGKPACYLRYNAVKSSNWDVFKVYQYVHFRSMNGLNPVYWINHADEMEQVLVLALQDVEKSVTQAQEWHRRIACHPLEAASSRFAIALEHIAACTSAT
jgi:hypothetical protein